MFAPAATGVDSGRSGKRNNLAPVPTLLRVELSPQISAIQQEINSSRGLRFKNISFIKVSSRAALQAIYLSNVTNFLCGNAVGARDRLGFGRVRPERANAVPPS